MKRLKTYLFALLPLAFITFSCDEEDILVQEQLDNNPLPGAETGDGGVLDLSNYISLGNSITAGFMDNALYTNGQNHSFPNLLATQFAIQGVGGGSFNQPDINSANGYSSAGPDNNPGTSDDLGRFELSLAQQRPVPTQGEFFGPYAGDMSELNNFGVPGMKITDATNPGFANPYYLRFASNPGTSTVLGDALSTSPTFFSYWLGNNDILGYAVAGGVDESSITSQPNFQSALEQSLGALVQSGAEGVVMTLPPFVLLPYFRAVPYNAIAFDADDQALVDQLNTSFAGLNQALDGLVQLSAVLPNVNVTQAEADARKVSYALGANPILMEDDALVDYDRPGGEFDILLATQQITVAQRQALAPYGQSRPATAQDLPVLTSATVLGTTVGGSATAVVGVSVPAYDNLILSVSEFETVVEMTATYNATIAGVVAGINAQANGSITLVDVQPAFADAFGLSPALANALFDPSNGANPALAAFADAAEARADGTLGIMIEGHNLQPDFAPNGIFSTDGIHPNPRGHAIIANLIIEALNNQKGADIPMVNVTALRGILARDF
ncbi:MAG: SGNH/GDSL hydrolase family protein [Roseivirga sp.]|uniref:SGNH/GDSL hydrolase family protein n=1 Tax=Roseivirga sp. TaxID=1964215 RepID=UPI001B06DCE5|nr:SGNH/GDSL hydrolase family protein [Roseivirga sp.]MBO6659519.1 SGNH/GDSL hydrolase family protein [Roseivirga sp.]MBO6907744.1 SGNH/GDSL hydrolase family protein [Roseivirga sp.]